LTPPTPYKKAAGIQLAERDFQLGLNCELWPAETHPRPKGWRASKSQPWLSRIIDSGEPTDEETPEGKRELACPIKESILRFPSAPIHGLHRLHEYHVNIGKSESFHTYRVLTSAKRRRTERVRRIFLMHNGLNEAESMGLYYRLASHLIEQDESGGTACILRPFPGHLTRSRFAGFAETPLDHYLWDGSHLFRQFLRYMIETQWFLSVIARRSSYRCISGLNLLAEDEDPKRSRLEDDVLAAHMWRAWDFLYSVSKPAVENAHAGQKNATPLDDPATEEKIRHSISALRSLLNLKEKLDGNLRPTDGPEPDVHVVGYSLGGFTAQSIFMSWPFMVASCSTLLSGGALRELAPTAFADPEEWQTVLHSLRYELDDAMLNNRYKLKSKLRGGIQKGQVSGIEFDLFLFLKSTFYEVFQQEYRGSFQTRLAAFRRRMLFIVGGNDPIVRPQSVLDSGPPDGINMLAVGGLGHFLGSKSQDDEEEQQRLFWLPRIGGLIDSLADDAAGTLVEERRENWLNQKNELEAKPSRRSGASLARTSGPLSAMERLEVDGEGALAGALFQRVLDDLLARIDARRGILFILRNEVPTALLEDDAIQQLAAGLHHNDVGIAKYIEGLRMRRELILDNPERVSLILPWNARTITEKMDAHPGHPSQSEGAGGQLPHRVAPRKIWKQFHDRCTEVTASAPHAVRVCDGRVGLEDTSGTPEVDTAALVNSARERLKIDDHTHRVTPSLPDCWVWMSPDFLALDVDESLTVEDGRSRLCEVVPREYDDVNVLSNRLRRDHLRIVTVSRSRYNPRFRGRIVVDPHVARKLLIHITLCIAVSVPFEDYDLHSPPPPPEEPGPA
jgi:pimeloyl-ACP methyl ester carboxylesterase